MARPRRIQDPSKLNLFLEKNHKVQALQLAAERRVSVSRLFVGWLLNDLENAKNRCSFARAIPRGREELDGDGKETRLPEGNGHVPSDLESISSKETSNTFPAEESPVIPVVDGQCDGPNPPG